MTLEDCLTPRPGQLVPDISSDVKTSRQAVETFRALHSTRPKKDFYAGCLRHRVRVRNVVAMVTGTTLYRTGRVLMRFGDLNLRFSYGGLQHRHKCEMLNHTAKTYLTNVSAIWI